MGSIATIITLGFGSFGSPGEVVTLGYAIGEAVVPPVSPTPTGRRCSDWTYPDRTATWDNDPRPATWESPSRSTRWYDDLCTC
jgi:hypothetical protein